MNGLTPFKLVPAFQDYLWGGRRLVEEFHKTPDAERYPAGTPIAESWECSTHPDGVSACESEGTGTLTHYLRAHPGALGTHPSTLPGELPVLIKLIDAAKPLSVQVHPDDDYARAHENGSLGKTEMWYVIDAAPGAKLVYGLTRTLTREELTQIVRQGKIERYLQEVPVHKGDVFFIPAGTVHAIGEGIVVYEVQQSSNLTYRLFDYHRRDKDGKERALHIDKALDVMNLQGSPAPRQKLRALRYKKGCAQELLCRCKYFQVERILVNTKELPEGAPFETNDNSFAVLTCTEGQGRLTAEDVAIDFQRGDSVFVPASCAGLALHGAAELLLTTC
ncbi:MAG: class I mannose-6-phosphate isomerase [Lachnospiraceae bacterium]|nr:class I mannose-6-phosphate isomerase [Lachnospiraceae bacterium]